MNKDRFQNVQYLGDAVYAGHDGYQVWIWTSDGENESMAIALERNTLGALASYAQRLGLMP